MTWANLGAILIGGALGAFFAILSIEFFHSNVDQLGYAAACTIFGGMICAVISAGMPQHALKSRRSGLSTDLDVPGAVQRQEFNSADSPPLSPQ